MAVFAPLAVTTGPTLEIEAWLLAASHAWKQAGWDVGVLELCMSAVAVLQ